MSDDPIGAMAQRFQQRINMLVAEKKRLKDDVRKCENDELRLRAEIERLRQFVQTVAESASPLSEQARRLLHE